VLAGAAVVLAKRHGGLRFPCYRHNEVSVRGIFANYPEVEVLPVGNNAEMRNLPPYFGETTGLCCGHYHPSPSLPGEGFDAWFYRQLEVPLDERWDSCPIGEAVKKEWQRPVPLFDYALIHDDPSRGYGIRREVVDALIPLKTFHVYGTSILRYADMLTHANEVHCINSSFFHLAESLKPKGNLFLHRYARPWAPIDAVKTRHTWEVVDT
jgi:hypothetical protein